LSSTARRVRIVTTDRKYNLFTALLSRHTYSIRQDKTRQTFIAIMAAKKLDL